MTVDRARIGWLAETLSDGDVADIVGCSRRTVIRVRQELGIPARYTPRRAPARVCSVVGCGRPVHGRGWCPAHYRRWSVLGDVWADVPVVATSRRVADRRIA